MSEGETESGSNEESVKLFVGQVPKHMSESQLLSIFKDFALVDEVSIIKDKTTRASRGCCFVICPSRKEADKAVNACHNKKTLPGASSPLQVKYADGEMERLEHKLFVGMLPKNISEAEMSALFTPYGTINDLQILRGCQEATKGCAFLKYETKEQAVAALEAMNGKYIMEGSGVPLVVKWADTEKERRARKAQKTQSQSSNPDSQHASLFGALPLGYVPPYNNGYGYQAPAPFGYMQYRLPTMQNQLKFHDMRGMTPSFGPGLAFRNYPLPSTSYVGSAYPIAPAIQYPMSYSGRLMSPRPLGNSPFSLPPITANCTSRMGKSSGSQIEGPSGANLFICHIPQDFDDKELANTFQAFGSILSAKVFIDKATGASKCFGFVSYDSPEAAQSAINTMNGSQLGGKKLKVQVKRENGQNSVYL